MFNKLLNLYRKNTAKTPLEDYTTEIFAGVLVNNKKFRNDFCRNFLGLESEFFSVRTQGKYYLKEYQDCIVDIVIEGSKEICFIENKVNSHEGHLQLKRYAAKLDEYKKREYNTKLVYCTKQAEPKDMEVHSFLQIRWYEIASFAKNYLKEDKLIKLFLDFLNNNNMHTDMTLRAADILAMENLARVFTIADEYLNRLTPKFIEIFGKPDNKTAFSFWKNQITSKDRLCIFKKGVLSQNNDIWTEVLYAIEFSGNLKAQIYVDNTATQYNLFVRHAKNEQDIKFIDYEKGSAVYLEQSLIPFINDEDAEIKIEKWFIEAFEKLRAFMDKTKYELDWT